MTRTPMLCCAVTVACALGLGACGGSDSSDETTTTAPAETVDGVPNLPPGWRVVKNRGQGFAFGLPPGWTAREGRAQVTIVNSVDRRIAITISADRTNEALAPPLDEYASDVAESLATRGFSDVRTDKAQPFRDRYDAVRLPASGRGPGGIRERILVFALRRDKIVNLTALTARRATVPSTLYQDDLERLVRSLRSRPPEVTG
jgi:hypothetical protein